MRFYGLSDQAVLGMPIRRFWMLSRAIARLRADEDLKQLEVLSAAQHPELCETLIARLEKVAPPAVVLSGEGQVATAERDEEGFEELRALSSKL